MGKHYQEQVRFVISHLEGSSGNFLGRLLSNRDLQSQTLWRVDTNAHPDVLSINGRDDMDWQLSFIKDHWIVVTHQFDKQILQQYFPYARLIQLWPYQQLGNVMYNACMKKSTTKIANLIDQHVINLGYWWDQWQHETVPENAFPFHHLRDQGRIESIMGDTMSQGQHKFFVDYWNQQLAFDLSWPARDISMPDMIDFWNIHDWVNPWSIAWLIFVYEKIHGYRESQRLWSIDTIQPQGWNDIFVLAQQYE